MNPSTTTQNLSPPSANPRRQPAHLSVSLRHEATPQSQVAVKGRSSSLVVKAPTTRSSSSRKTSPSTSSREHNSRKWFNKANENPELPFSQALQDEPPYFLPQRSSHGSEIDGRRDQSLPYSQIAYLPETRQFPSATNASNASDFRSVIDDLTIENKKLKERLKRLEKNHSPQLENERLFEVTIHGLSARKRGKLEEKLREFTASLEDSSSEDNGTSPPDDPRSDYIGALGGQKRSNGSSNSVSRPPDSAYASMSNDPQNSSSNMTTVNTGGKAHSRAGKGSAENAETIQNFLEGIPEGLLPKGKRVLTERQKQKIVVRRLEQLFTGKQGLGVLDNQLAQQQEVADSAARADDSIINGVGQQKGVREAHMLPQIEISSRPGNMPVGQSRDDIPNSLDDSPEPMDVEQHQRPTRPLDLDPDRAQVAADNVEYIRHLGLSTPQLLSEDSSDAEPDAQGWVYLNLLINMAQLHIINVTPDFVRRAVKDVSQKLQLSQDGHKLRWRGGSKGTKLSSSDDASTDSLNDTDNIASNAPKRRKMDSGRFAAVPVNVQKARKSDGIRDAVGFHYRPMFNHQSASTDTSDSTDSGTSSVYEKSFAAETGKNTNSSRGNSGQPFSRTKKRGEDGTMVFYSNAQFCTDLAGDRKIPTPLYLEPGQEHGLGVRHVLGADYRHKVSRISRFDSSSVKTSEPFNATSFQFTQSDVSDVSIYSGSRSVDESSPSEVLQDFEACGLGGTQPADHFVVRVRSRRRQNLGARKPTATSPSTLKRKMIFHRVPQASLKAFAASDHVNHEESLTANMASLSASSPPTDQDNTEMPVEVEYLSAKYTRLEPSRLPEPMGYYGIATSDDESTSYESSSGISALARQTLNRSRSAINGAAQNQVPNSRRMASEMEYESDEGDSEEEEEDDDDDMSIDMLGHLRMIAPSAVAARENSYDLKNEGRGVEVPVSAAATVAESGDEL